MSLRVVFIHGLGQSDELFMQRTLKFRQALSDYVNLTYVNAPYLLLHRPAFHEKECENKSDEEIRVIEERLMNEYYSKNQKLDSYGRTWFYTDRYGYCSSNLRNVEAIGVDVSLDYVISECKRINADGIFGYSQGALLTTLLLKRLQVDNSSGWNPKFCILFSGPTIPCVSICERLEVKPLISTPSLHFLSKEDVRVSIDRSIALSKAFQDPIIHYHKYGHVVPIDECLDVYKSFLSKFNI